MGGHGTDSSGQGLVEVAWCYKYGNESPRSLKFEEFLDLLRNCQLFEFSAP